jgi:hypothetical protein
MLLCLCPLILLQLRPRRCDGSSYADVCYSRMLTYATGRMLTYATGEATALRRQVQEASELLRHERAQHASERLEAAKQRELHAQVLTYADVC